MTTLTEHLDRATAPAADNTTIGDDRHAEWVAAKLRDLQLRRDEVVAQANEQRRLIDEWQQSLTSELDAQIEFREGQLVRYLQTLREADDKVSSHKLPSATITSRKGRTSVQVPDEAAFAAWAQANPDLELASTVVKPDKKRLGQLSVTGDGQLVTEAGEVVPGVGIVQGDRTYAVKVNR